MAELAVFLHLANVGLWSYIESYLLRIPFKFQLYVSLCSELSSSEAIRVCQHNICKVFSNTEFYHLPNRGCDIGPFFFFLEDLRQRNIPHKWIIKLHSKTDEKWRKLMLDRLIPQNFNEFYNWMNSNQNAKIIGAYRYHYDYVNIYYDLDHLKSLGIPVNTNWDKYTENFPSTSGKTPVEKSLHALEDLPHRLSYVPQIDLESYSLLFSSMKPDDTHLVAADKYWDVMFRIAWHKLSKLWYFPGTFFIVNHDALLNLFDGSDLNNIYTSLETGKPDDRTRPSKTHSWERILPVAIQLKFGDSALVCPIENV